jgi:hypothetical protein
MYLFGFAAHLHIDQLIDLNLRLATDVSTFTKLSLKHVSANANERY